MAFQTSSSVKCRLKMASISSLNNKVLDDGKIISFEHNNLEHLLNHPVEFHALISTFKEVMAFQTSSSVKCRLKMASISSLNNKVLDDGKMISFEHNNLEHLKNHPLEFHALILTFKEVMAFQTSTVKNVV